MGNDLNDLINVLSEEKCLYKKLLELSGRKTEVIISNNIQELDKIVKQEQFVLIRLSDEEKARKTLLSKIAQDMNVPEEELTITQVIQKIDKSQKNTFSDIVSELTIILKKQKDLNERNMHLIQNNLEYINEIISQVIIGNAEKKTYNITGNREMVQNRNIIDQCV